jgi:hypothetical protein
VTIRARAAVLGVFLLTTTMDGCTRDGYATLARSVDRAASWAAAVEFAAGQARNRQVPRTYFRDLVATAVANLDRIAADVDKMTDVDAVTRTHAATMCRQVAERFRRQLDVDSLPDPGELRALEMELRASARGARDLSARHRS